MSHLRLHTERQVANADEVLFVCMGKDGIDGCVAPVRAVPAAAEHRFIVRSPAPRLRAAGEGGEDKDNLFTKGFNIIRRSRRKKQTSGKNQC